LSPASPRILLSCDDGLGSEGTARLAPELARLGTVRACAPESPSSGAGHAVTLHGPIASLPAELAGCEEAVAVRGTPADSVKLALARLWPGWTDLVVSGINRGPNVGVNVFYSGTVGAAAEAAVFGVPGIAVSLDVSGRFDFGEAALRARPVLERLAALLPFPPGAFFNVNLPASDSPARGVRLTRHGRSGFREYYTPAGADGADAADGVRRWQVEGDFQVGDPDETYDAAALAAGFISVTPMELDLTVDPLRAAPPGRAAGVEALLEKLADWR
jgi:5'-nucleotidase